MGIKLSEKYIRPKRIKLYNDALKNKGFENRGEVIETKSIEYKDFNEFIEKNGKKALLHQPIVFRGAAKNWPCVQKWSKDYFRENYSSTKIALIDNPGLVDKDKENVYKKTSFSEFLDESEKDKSKYLRFSRVLDNNPELLNDLDLDWLRSSKFGLNFGEQTFLFIGEEGSKTPTHAGLTHTTFIEISGQKKWTLWAPNERFFLDPVAERLLYFYTNADPYKKNQEKYPLLPYAKKYELVLDKGDILWFPSLFWHHIENLTPTIGVAYKYTNIPQSMRISKGLATLFYMGTKPNIIQSFIYNRKNSQDLVFDRKTK